MDPSLEHRPPPDSTTRRQPAFPNKWRAFCLAWLALASLGAAIALPVRDAIQKRQKAAVACRPFKEIDGAIQQWALENKKSTNVSVTATNVLDLLKGSVVPTAPGNDTNTPSSPTTAQPP